MLTRVISAVAAVGLIALITIYGKTEGLKYFCVFMATMATLEYRRLIFSRFEWPLHLQVAFVLVSMITFFATLGDPQWAPVALGIGAAIYFAIAVLLIRTPEDLNDVLSICGMSCVGFLYCGLFSGLATSVLNFRNGPVWLFGLMAVVFTGDTFAYLFGRVFGKRKLLEPVSPKKTVEGALGGLFGSALAGAIIGTFFIDTKPIFPFIILALTTGAFAQIGDLFESLMKRVADVKDSGAIMPGHGGVLDRIDGLLFAAPVYYVLARFLVL